MANETVGFGYAKQLDLEKIPVTFSKLYSDTSELERSDIGGFRGTERD